MINELAVERRTFQDHTRYARFCRRAFGDDLELHDGLCKSLVATGQVDCAQSRSCTLISCPALCWLPPSGYLVFLISMRSTCQALLLAIT
jgi:hypothetical protein